ncbi:ADP-forming succinate--CoA ligase subunit beta [soil metagenome]|jgi:succinyl-CoA synthetase beta subunit|nr:ADP-forming succinate--CoA ligase subunit beta [Gemmatimonadota bacterium]MDQ3523088.1 ADP-forming succinate--CoA ligase subunit beta [Gemmatimonadota bacterium]
MNIHEYQARDILSAHGVPVPDGEVATTADEAERIARRLGGKVVIKAQVHAGGRGKAGGVKLADTAEEAREHAGRILGMEIKGLPVLRVLVAPAEEIASEAYVGIIVDRASKAPVFMVSREGGVDIEEVAATNPDAIRKQPVDPRYGLLPHQAYSLATALYDDVRQQRAAAKILQQLYAAFVDAGASLAEINPLVTTPDGDVKALDAKINIDENELFRKPEVEALRDPSAEAPSEVAAREAGLTFIKLDGDVGCCVNGAGLAMATMDLVKYYGGDPANFLDIGGSSNPEKVVNALRIITSDPSVRVILFNIFGGITRCDDVANGIVTATRQITIDVPIVIRLTGTNEELAVQILEEAGFSAMTDMDEAVKRAVDLAKGEGK